jgi:hypothetical protein
VKARRRIEVCGAVLLLLALACVVVPSWPLAFACAVVACVVGALLWDADRARATAKVLAEMAPMREEQAKLHGALAEHAKAIADLRHRLNTKTIAEEQVPFAAPPWSQPPPG